MLLVGLLLAQGVQHTCMQVSLETIHLPTGGGYMPHKNICTSASWEREMSTRVLAAGWTTSSSFMIVAPSLEMVVLPERERERTATAFKEGEEGGRVNLDPSPLWLPTLHSGSGPALPCKCTRTFNFWEIFKHAFKIYSIWPQASNTHICAMQSH